VDSPASLDLGRPRSIGQLFTTTLVLYGRYPLLFLALAAGVVVPYDLLRLALTGVGSLSVVDHDAGTSLLLELLDFSLVGPLVSALHMHAVSAIGEGRRPRLLTVARDGLVVLPLVAATEIAANLGIFAGLLLLIIPGIVLMLRWAVAAQVASIERVTWVAALGRSRRLGAGRYPEIFLMLMCLALIGFLVHLVARSSDLDATLGSASVSAVALGMAVDTVLASLSALVLAVLYFDLRARETDPPRRPPRAYEHLRDLD